MLAAIELNHHPAIETDEVEIVASERPLPSKLKAARP